MQLESKYCRGPLAYAFNACPFTVWVPNRNVAFANNKEGVKGQMLESGLPDSFVFSQGRAVHVECKAGIGSIYMGADRRVGWRANQRDWYRENSVPTMTPYLLGIWIYKGARLPDRVKHDDAYMYLVPGDVFMATEIVLKAQGSDLMLYTECETLWGKYRVKYLSGIYRVDIESIFNG